MAKKRAAAGEGETKPYETLTPFEHDGESIEIGGTVMLTEEQAAQHLASKSVKPLEAAAAEATE